MTVPDIFSIGELADRASCQVETVRYYERAGIMPSPPRSGGGHRQYSFKHLKRLSFVRRCRDLGINLKRTRGLLELVDEGGNTCSQVKEIASAHLAEIRNKLSDLRKMEGVMNGMVAACDEGEIPDCPIEDRSAQDERPRLSRLEAVTLQETVYRELKRTLMAGGFLPGETLTIRSLAEALGTSTMPVREALQRLVAERGLMLLPNRSAQVPVLTKESFEDLTRIRLELEGFAAELAASRITESEIDELSRALRQMEMADEADDGDDFSSGNQKFHFIIYRATRSEYLVPIIESMWLCIGPFLAFPLRTRGPLSKLAELMQDQQHHEAAIAAFRARDGAAARKAIRDDLAQAARWYDEHYDFPQNVEADAAKK